MLRRATNPSALALQRTVGGALLEAPANRISSSLPNLNRTATSEPAASPDETLDPRVDRLLNGLAFLALALLVVTLLSGCASAPLNDQVYGHSYTPSNIFQADRLLSPQVKRVAVLPLAVLPGTPDEAQETLEPILHAELTRINVVEWSLITQADLRRTTGHRTLASDEQLPADLLETIRSRYGCQAVLFVQLTRYHPFRPVALGWRLKLADCGDGRILWAADESFDSGVVAVTAAARRHYQREIHAPSVLADSRTVLESPRFFAQYSLRALLETLPGR